MPNNKISGWVIFGLLFSVLAVVLLVLSGYGYQWGWWKLGTAFTWLLPGSILLGLLGFIFGLIYWFARHRGMADGGEQGAWTAIILGLAVLGTVGYWFYQANQFPPIHDITTDTQHPPSFKNIVALRAGAANDTAYGGSEIAQIQHKHYPDIQTLVMDAVYDETFNRALQAARKQPWEKIVTSDRQAGLIEASDKLPWFGFVDDIVIRIDSTANEGQTKIDVRSVSRIGKGDIGVNAQRIREYLDTIRTME